MDPTKLRDRFTLQDPYLGRTTDGAQWAMKALHPACNTAAITGIPDRTGVPVAVTEFKSSYTIQNTVNALNFDAVLTFLPSPQLFGTSSMTQAGVQILGDYFVNTQLSGAGLTEKRQFWHQQVATARLAYYGITISYDCATLTDNGTLTAGQTMPCWVLVSSTNPATQAYSGIAITYGNLINMPLAVQYRARDGAYMPVKLTNPALPFIDQSNDFAYGGWYPVGQGLPNNFLMSQLLDGQMASVAFRNVSASTMLRVTVRMGLEVTPTPGSSYSSFMHPSPLPDSLALDAYYTISAHMNDAYPDEFNDWNKLKQVVSKIGRFLLPALGLAGDVIAPGLGTAVTHTLNLGARGINAIVEDTGKRKQRKLNQRMASLPLTAYKRVPPRPPTGPKPSRPSSARSSGSQKKKQ